MEQRVIFISDLLFCLIALTVSIFLWLKSNPDRETQFAQLPATMSRRIIAAIIDSIRWYIIIVIEALTMVIINTALLHERMYGFETEASTFRTVVVSLFGYLFATAIIAYQNTYSKQSFGKRFVRVHVVKLDGTIPNWNTLFIRNLLSLLSILLFFSGFITMLSNSRRQAMHDILTGTMVVATEKTPCDVM
jgi:uncharacterized RDD family membrane protein YckC